MAYASIEKLKESLKKVSHFNNEVCSMNIISYYDEQRLLQESLRLRNEENYNDFRRLLGFSAEEASSFTYQSYEDESSTEDEHEDTSDFNKQRMIDIEIRNYMIEAGVATFEPFDAKQYFLDLIKEERETVDFHSDSDDSVDRNGMGGIDDKRVKKKSLIPVHPNFVPVHAKNSAKKANLTKHVTAKHSDKEATITKPVMAKYSLDEKPQVKVQPPARRCRNAVVLQFLAKLTPEDKSQKWIPEVKPKVVPPGLKVEKRNLWTSTSGDRSCSYRKEPSSFRRISDKPTQDMGLDVL